MRRSSIAVLVDILFFVFLYLHTNSSTYATNHTVAKNSNKIGATMLGFLKKSLQLDLVFVRLSAYSISSLFTLGFHSSVLPAKQTPRLIPNQNERQEQRQCHPKLAVPPLRRRRLLLRLRGLQRPPRPGPQDSGDRGRKQVQQKFVNL